MLIRIAAALMIVAGPAMAKDKCVKPEVAFKEFNPQISPPTSGIPFANAKKFIEEVSGKPVGKDPDALQIGLFPDGTMGLFFMHKGCMVGLAPIPKDAVEKVGRAILGEPA